MNKLQFMYTEAGKLHQLSESRIGTYLDGRTEVTVTSARINGECTKITAVWYNCTSANLVIQPEVRVITDFRYTQYVIPGITVNGNNWGSGKEPKNLACDGERWIFDYRRTPIPSCTISENEDRYTAVFASDENSESLISSCAMIEQENGTMAHCILYPCIEKPKTYRATDYYVGPHEDFITIEPYGSFTASFYVMEGKTKIRNFAAAQVEDTAIDLLGKEFKPAYSVEETEKLCCEFAKHMIVDINNRKLFCISRTINDDGTYQYYEGNEFGWCGQNGMYSKLFLIKGFREHDSFYTDIAVGDLDAYTHEGVGKTGMVHCHYDRMVKHSNDMEDTCNLGYSILELTEAYRIAKDNGIDRPEWLETAKNTADFMLEHYNDKTGFGKYWNVETGEEGDPNGTVGAYIIPGLVVLYKETKEEKYLTSAEKAMRFYVERDLKNFMCTAGALDTDCIDKETSGPIISGSLYLYDITKDSEWLEYAKLASWYFCSWMYHHDIIPDKGSDFDVYNYRTLGGTMVSAQHHHIDPWGALMIPQFMNLYRITGDSRWKKRAELIWCNCIQSLAPMEGRVIHGKLRDAGTQNEGYHHCVWGDEWAPGYINEWLVAWPQAFIWLAAEDGELEI